MGREAACAQAQVHEGAPTLCSEKGESFRGLRVGHGRQSVRRRAEVVEDEPEGLVGARR